MAAQQLPVGLPDSYLLGKSKMTWSSKNDYLFVSDR